MAIYFFTTDPNGLLANFRKRIFQEEQQGKITTWEEKDGYFTHKSKEWQYEAWFKPSIAEGKNLTFNIVKSQNKDGVSSVAYGYYHGHLTETFLNHFDKLFSSAQSSALPAAGDIVSSK
ncbi:hypothetical protein [Burkholderia pyrrocinia]|uniref:hypothetical protein n=1 Tax=Burkholderia pyrrocinia TaxID=60550 RepID=UPI001BCF4779|nr:hypothetical protein [Burkholderia pyrrocinia]QVN19008.1 hypothetical protein JYG32_04545 [Burkholderia pyrrocinia]